MLNKNQIQIIIDFLKFPIGDILELQNIDYKLQAFEAILKPTLTTSDKQQLDTLGVLQSVKQIRKILSHPYPQNLSSGTETENGEVIFHPIGFHNGSAKENEGYLGLTAQDDIRLYVNRLNRAGILNHLKELFSEEKLVGMVDKIEHITHDKELEQTISAEKLNQEDEEKREALFHELEEVIKNTARDANSYFIFNYKVTAQDVIYYIQNRIKEEIAALKLVKLKEAIQEFEKGEAYLLTLSSERLAELALMTSNSHPQLSVQLYLNKKLWDKLDFEKSKKCELISSNQKLAIQIYQDEINELVKDKQLLAAVSKALANSNPEILRKILVFLLEQPDAVFVSQFSGQMNNTNIPMLVSFGKNERLTELISAVIPKNPKLAAEFLVKKDVRENLTDTQLTLYFSQNPQIANLFYKKGKTCLLSLRSIELYTLCSITLPENSNITYEILDNNDLRNKLSTTHRYQLIVKNVCVAKALYDSGIEFLSTFKGSDLFAICVGTLLQMPEVSADIFLSPVLAQIMGKKYDYYLEQLANINPAFIAIIDEKKLIIELVNHFNLWVKEKQPSDFLSESYWLAINDNYLFMQWLRQPEVNQRLKNFNQIVKIAEVLNQDVALIDIAQVKKMLENMKKTIEQCDEADQFSRMDNTDVGPSI